MKDRVPNYPGRVRLTPVPGMADIYDLIMADAPIEEGTPPIKANLIDDITALMYKLQNTDPESLLDFATVNNALRRAFDVFAPMPRSFLTEFTASGTFNIASFGLSIGDKIDAYIVGAGAGAGGGPGWYSSGLNNYPGLPGGGGGGYCILLRDFILTQATYSIIIGAKGIGGLGGPQDGDQSGQDGTPGGNTTAFGVTANGGQPGTRGRNNQYAGSNGVGGDGGSGGGNGVEWPNTIGGIGGTDGANGNPGGLGGGMILFQPRNPYDNIPYGCGGGGPNANGGGIAGSRGSGGTGGDANPIGGGGGGARPGAMQKGGDGGSGLVMIYR